MSAINKLLFWEVNKGEHLLLVKTAAKFLSSNIDELETLIFSVLPAFLSLETSPLKNWKILFSEQKGIMPTTDIWAVG